MKNATMIKILQDEIEYITNQKERIRESATQLKVTIEKSLTTPFTDEDIQDVNLYPAAEAITKLSELKAKYIMLRSELVQRTKMLELAEQEQ